MKDDEMLRLMRSGNPRGLEALMDRYIPYVSVICWNVLRDCMAKEDAEEVVSDVFLAAWNQADKIQPDHTKAWLGAVARNKARNKRREMEMALPLEEDILEIPDENTPDGLSFRAEESRQIRRAVDLLGEPDREVFLRHYYFCQTVQEIGTCMHLKESTVKTKLRRGRMRLRELLTRWDVR